MTGNCHVRICEGLGVKFPRATRLLSQLTIVFLAAHILSPQLGVVEFNKKGAVRGVNICYISSVFDRP